MNIISKDEKAIQSASIDLLRFPLAIMVIFIHLNPTTINLIDADFPLFSTKGLFNITGITFTNVLTHIAVPTFFFISGLLFFIGLQKWDWKLFIKKISNRILTLFIPYVTWNTIAALFGILSIVISNRNNMTCICESIFNFDLSIYYNYHKSMTAPYVLPLWFVRDLMVVTLMAPIIYYILRKTRKTFILLLMVFYLFDIWLPLPGFSITSIFFFSLGAFFTLNNIPATKFAVNNKWAILSLCSTSLLACIVFDGGNTLIGKRIMPVYIISGVFAIFLLAHNCIKKGFTPPGKQSIILTSCFFIYAFHTVEIPQIGTPLKWSGQIMEFIIPGVSGIKSAICYFTRPFLTAFICICTLMTIRFIFPKFARILAGNK